MDSFEHTTMIDATSIQVLSACLDPEALKTWWKARNAVVQPRPGGLLVLEWDPGSLGQDELLGPLGGTLAGILDKSMSGHFVQFGALHWLTPRGEVFGPTRLEIDVFSKGDPRRKPTRVRVLGSAFQDGQRWERYRAVSEKLWGPALDALRNYCETQALTETEAEKATEPLGGPYLAEAVLRDRRIS